MDLGKAPTSPIRVSFIMPAKALNISRNANDKPRIQPQPSPEEIAAYKHAFTLFVSTSNSMGSLRLTSYVGC